MRKSSTHSWLSPRQSLKEVLSGADVPCTGGRNRSSRYAQNKWETIKPTGIFKGHFRRLERHSHLLLRFPKVFLGLIKSKITDIMKVSVVTIFLAVTANFSGVYGQNMEVSANISNHAQCLNLPLSNVTTIHIVP
jgi:hypothetical protein